jgi:sulfoxide reductase heme-binding subunit YedZ
MMGLFTFFEAFVHLMTYVWLDQFFAFDEIAKDIVKRPFILSGMTGFTLMIPLAITSTKKWIARLGKRWQLLHRLVYFSAAAGVIHYYFFVKSDIQFPVAYGVLLAVLLGIRAWFAIQPRKRAMISVG